MSTRTERDTMGEMQVPADALYGASTARAVENFPIARRPLPAAMIHAFGHLKAACAIANRDLGKLEADITSAIVAAADEVATGQHDAHFPVDVYQTGSGTSTNMNANEVIATLATRSLGRKVHPNDHVNMGQSSNDTFPTAMNLAAVLQLRVLLDDALPRLERALERLSNQWDTIIKVGRTHLMDATPIRMGQVFGGYRAQIHDATRDLRDAMSQLSHNLAIGGTAVGTGINTDRAFGQTVAEQLTRRLSPDRMIEFKEAGNHPAAQASRDDIVGAHGSLKRLAVSLSRIASDIRLLASGPRCGIGELILPAVQPGSSIMPGKVNPVLCESMMQVACRVIGNDATITTAGLGGVGSIFELNVAMPVIADAFLESVSLLTNVSSLFVGKVLDGLQVDERRCRELLERSVMTITALVPALGYDRCADLAKRAMKEDRTIRELVLEAGLLPPEELDKLLDPDAMIRPG
ncbi:MAG TPA: class II fumarate hydratase [Tepidisphaeraceae bacterium]|nr:class II fumarate hydratase [Tepidisphaeraceae bacterium]